MFELCRLWPSRFASFERLEWHPNGTQIIITIISLCSVAGLSWKWFPSSLLKMAENDDSLQCVTLDFTFVAFGDLRNEFFAFSFFLSLSLSVSLAYITRRRAVKSCFNFASSPLASQSICDICSTLHYIRILYCKSWGETWSSKVWKMQNAKPIECKKIHSKFIIR